MCVDVAALYKTIRIVFHILEQGCLNTLHNFKGCLD
ncbi:unnamed protein product [Staurois parvus]|uniref:Uncharacterized protein n=1 Tax=Staurois parvus TaxID=386267 RepID=A0ABN9AG51_9NEOB|nr:unnamed protein product [Staurois parvus]